MLQPDHVFYFNLGDFSRFPLFVEVGAVHQSPVNSELFALVSVVFNKTRNVSPCENAVPFSLLLVTLGRVLVGCEVESSDFSTVFKIGDFRRRSHVPNKRYMIVD